MPAIVLKSIPTVVQTRREILHAISWQVRSNSWSPPTDVYETEDGFIVKVEIAGMREEDFEVVIEGSILRVNGNRPDLSERRAFHQMEIRFGKFEIAVEFPSPFESEESMAEYRDGFLIVNLPKKPARAVKDK